MVNPTEYRYTKDHEWVAVDGKNKGKMGLTWYAQDMLGDIVYLKLPAPGTRIRKGKKIGEVESVKAVSPIYGPVNGQVVALNKKVKGTPQVINKDPYGEGWIIEVKLAGASATDGLMDSKAYTAYVATLGEH